MTYFTPKERKSIAELLDADETTSAVGEPLGPMDEVMVWLDDATREQRAVVVDVAGEPGHRLYDVKMRRSGRVYRASKVRRAPAT